MSLLREYLLSKLIKIPNLLKAKIGQNAYIRSPHASSKYMTFGLNILQGWHQYCYCPCTVGDSVACYCAHVACFIVPFIWAPSNWWKECEQMNDTNSSSGYMSTALLWIVLSWGWVHLQIRGPVAALADDAMLTGQYIKVTVNES